jgi:hypothetical protein
MAETNVLNSYNWWTVSHGGRREGAGVLEEEARRKVERQRC